MLYRLLFLLACMGSLHATAQKEDLYYFCNKDSSQVGVRSKSRIVIPAQYNTIYSASCGDKVTKRLITLIGKSDTFPNDQLHYTNDFKIFNREGRFLYSVYFFDNGPDYFKEGVRRFVDGQKMGLVDRFGNKIIPAVYNYIEPFYRGYALACLDCKLVRVREDEEHCCAILGSKYQLIDRNGTAVSSFTSSEEDLWRNGSVHRVILTQPLITPQEQRLATQLRSVPTIRKALKDLSYDNEPIYTVVAEHPSSLSPYYLICFRTTNSCSGLMYLISKDGKIIRQLTDDGEEAKLK